MLSRCMLFVVLVLVLSQYFGSFFQRGRQLCFWFECFRKVFETSCHHATWDILLHVCAFLQHIISSLSIRVGKTSNWGSSHTHRSVLFGHRRQTLLEVGNIFGVHLDAGWGPEMSTRFCGTVTFQRGFGISKHSWVMSVFWIANLSFFLGHQFLPFPFLYATRVGEAINPGPTHDFCVGLVNPTAIYRKSEIFEELSNTYGIDLFGISETSATITTQKIVTAQTNRFGYKSLWSTPVEDHTLRSDGRPSLRGKAGGVAVISRFPCRHAQGSIQDRWTSSSRIIHTVITIANMQVQVVTVYGVTSSHHEASAFNSGLLSTAFEASRQLLLPTLILGDWNCDPKSLDAWAQLEADGFADLKMLYPKIKGGAFPFTCKEATSPDNAICCPKFAQWLVNIQVSDDYFFDAHKTVILNFRIPGDAAFRYVLPLPKTWLLLPMDEAFLPSSYSDVVRIYGKPNDLQEWGSRVEKAVDLAYQSTQALDSSCTRVKTMPSMMKGRCKPRQPVKVPVRSFDCRSRNGDYNPTYEIHSHRVHRIVRQVRRLQSLYRNISKGLRPDASNWYSWQEQWNAIVKDRSFGSFAEWCQTHPEIGPLPSWVPSLDGVYHIFQLAKFESDRLCAEEHQIWVKKQSFARHLDSKCNGSSKAFKLMTNKVLPPLTEISQEICHEAVIVADEDQHYTVHVENNHGFVSSFPLIVDDRLVQVQKVCEDYLIVHSPNHDIESESITVRQEQTLSSPNEIFRALNDYWVPFWTSQGEPSHHEDFETFLHSIPHQAAMQVDTSDVGVWMEAIRSLKPVSARGVDGISSSELKQLPLPCIQDLIDILNAFENGFPSWMMLSLCFPLPKKWPHTKASQTRPITVMAQIYRLWSCVVSRQLLRNFSRFFPCEITGMLPGRGSSDASYFQQFLIEKFHAMGQPYSGLCLDLVKCFNTICRPRVALLLASLGIPSIIIDTWFHSVSHLQRIWMINGQTSKPVPCDNGCPEGDSLSVVCILAIAFLWIHHVRSADQSSHVSAYADNWGWLSTDVAAHAHIVDVTLKTVRRFGHSIDWDKSWIWASNQEHLHFVKQAVETQVGSPVVHKLSRGVDLGCQRSYTGPPRLGSLRDKFVSAQNNLQRLKTFPHTLRVKTHLVQAGVYPAVFYGCELVPIGETHLDQLRSDVAAALLGSSISRNSAVALQMIPALRDPEEEVLLRIFFAAKRFLFRATPTDRQAFFDILARHSGRYADCRGPIGTLKFHALRLGWSFSKEGHLLHDPFRSSLFIDLSKRQLAVLISRAWNEHLLVFYAQRKAWKGLPPMAPFETRQIIQSFPIEKQILLIQEISAAFQTAVQQAVWDSSVSDTCSFCSQTDTRHHRIFTCDAVQDLRAPYAETLAHFEEMGSLVHELPVIHVSHDWSYHDLVHHQQPEIPFDLAFCDKVRNLEQLGHRCTFFTDGSCMNPHSRATRYSAFAIVFDMTISVAERHSAVLDFQQSRVLPSCLSCVYQARTQGEQHIHRAELFAVLILVETFSYAKVYTDSQLVIFVVQACRSVPSPQHLYHLDNFDLVRRYWVALRRGDFEILKVKAHVEPSSIDLDAAFITLGNQKANDCAIHACKNLQPYFVRSLQKAHESLHHYQVHLKSMFELILAIGKRRASLNSENQKSNNQVVGCKQTSQHLFSHWTVDQPAILPIPRMNLQSKVAWGHLIAEQLDIWQSQIIWPTQPAVPDDCGVTWVELSLSFALHIGMPLPVKRADASGVERLTVFSSSAEVEAFDLKLSEHANAFSILWKEMGDFRDSGFGPPIDRGLVRSLYVQGATFQSYGFRWRPQFPSQKQVADILHPYLQKLEGTSFSTFPVISWRPWMDLASLRRDFALAWPRKLTASNLAAREVRLFRKNPQGTLRFQ